MLLTTSRKGRGMDGVYALAHTKSAKSRLWDMVTEDGYVTTLRGRREAVENGSAPWRGRAAYHGRKPT